MKKIWKWLLFVLVILLAAGCVFLYRYINRIRYNDGYTDYYRNISNKVSKANEK